ncbi:unnamed protein product, partial [Mesorhabditis spiculigera]
MGVCSSSLTDEEKATMKSQEETHRKIEDELRKDVENDKTVIKLLLLGPGESGKSTVLKQMRIIHNNGFTDAEKVARREAVWNNTVQSMYMLICGLERIGYQVLDKNMRHLELIKKTVGDKKDWDPITEDVCNSIKALWDDKGIRAAYERRSEFQLNDSAVYFFEAVERTSRPHYIPSVQDILMTRVATSGVQEIRYTYKEIEFKIYDVGGQKSERRKWIHCFDSVDALLFVVAISEYDQTLREDGVTNRLRDSQILFKDIINNDYLRRAQAILFLNKKDLFAEKITRVPLSICFTKYTGTNSYEECTEYMEKRFLHLNADPDKMLYIHITCATDTNQVQLVLTSVTDMIIAENFKQTGVM